MKKWFLDTASEAIQSFLKKKNVSKKQITKQSEVFSVQKNTGWRLSDTLNFAKDSGHETEVLKGFIFEQQATIENQNRIIDGQRFLIKRHSRTSGIILAVSASVWGIVWGVGTALHWQLSPESQVQETVSSLARVFSATKTGYEIIQEGKDNVFLVKKQADKIEECNKSNESLKNTNALQEEIIGTDQIIIGLDQSKIANLSAQLEKERKKSESCDRSGKIQIAPNREEEKQSEKFNTEDSSKIFNTFSVLRVEMVEQFADKNIEIRIQEQSGGGILIWIQKKGKNSLGFYANSEKNKNRLTKEGMALWIQFSIDQLSLVEQIESIAFSKNIGSSKDSFVSMDKPKKLYSGNVKITLSDSLTKKTGSFIVKSKNTSPENISQEFDTILKDFVPDETKETL